MSSWEDTEASAAWWPKLILVAPNTYHCQYPVSPYTRNEESRFKTFDHRWPASNVRASPRQINKAGFFFLGDRDRVKCWYCNGDLQNWDPDYEPWTEHAKCEFVLQRKGPDFVHRMVSLYPNLPHQILRGPFDVNLFTSQPLQTTYGENSSEPEPMEVDITQEERLREMEEERKCKICLDKVADIVFVPCGHLCTCTECADYLRKCPICRSKIERGIKTYMS